MDEVILKIPEQYPMTDDEFFALCAVNKELRIERDKEGQLILMSPAGGATGHLNFRLTGIFGRWVEDNPALGYGFSSSTEFRLPDKSMRSPNVSWVRREKWDNLSIEEKEKFPPVCPDFVIELRSKSDSIQDSKSKMEDWMINGCRMAWLIDPFQEKVYIYETGKAVQEVTGFHNKLSGEDLLPGFVLDLSKIRQ